MAFHCKSSLVCQQMSVQFYLYHAEPETGDVPDSLIYNNNWRFITSVNEITDWKTNACSYHRNKDRYKVYRDENKQTRVVKKILWQALTTYILTH